MAHRKTQPYLPLNHNLGILFGRCEVFGLLCSLLGYFKLHQSNICIGFFSSVDITALLVLLLSINDLLSLTVYKQ